MTDSDHDRGYDPNHDGRPPFRLDHVGLVVPNASEAAAWYTRLLGPVVAWVEASTAVDDAAIGLPGEDVRLCGRVAYAGGAYLEFHEFETPPSRDLNRRVSDFGFGHVAFYTPNIDAAYQWLTSEGVNTWYAEPRIIEQGGLRGHTWVYFQDPWGNVLQLCSHPAPPVEALAVYGDAPASVDAVNGTGVGSGGTTAED